MRPVRIKACVAEPNVRRRDAAAVHGTPIVRIHDAKQARSAAAIGSINRHLLSERQDVAKTAFWWDALEIRGAPVGSDTYRRPDGGSMLRRWEQLV